MNIVAFLIGVLLPTLNGTLLVRMLEGRTAVLARAERIALGCTLGITLMMFFVFLVHIATGLGLTLLTFLIVQLLCTGILFSLWARNKFSIFDTSAHFAPSHSLNRSAKILFGALGVWMFAKIIAASTVFLLLTPTYLDDTLDNWNLRAKVFFTDHTLTLVMPNESAVTSPMDVSSYPPTVPLMKTWTALIARNWSDGLVNSIHIVWYLCAFALVFYAIRRHVNLFWSLTGTYLLGSIPLYLMHGTNTYADAFLSVHVFAAISMLFHMARATSEESRHSFIKIGAVCAALLPFTKNEGLLVYLPPILLILVVILWDAYRKREMSITKVVHTLVWYAVPLLCIAVPWLLFKWSHGLTFGNAKPFTTLGFGWQENVLHAIGINTFFEGNWILLFPLLFSLLIWRWKSAFRTYIILSGFFLIVYLGQGSLYLFTGLSIEALKQTGYARGLVQMTPTVILLVTLLLADGLPKLSNALAVKPKIATE